MALEIARDKDELELEVEGHPVKLTNLQKLFWPDLGITKGDLLRYYAAIAPVLLPHIRDRAMVMKRYPHGAYGEFFFQKHAPAQKPEWIPACSIEHASGNVVDFPVINDLPSLLWVVNLGCIDLNPWYARCDDVQRPDYLHFDLDPVPEAGFECVVETALMLRETLEAMKIPSYPKTTGSRGLHVYVPIVRGPVQKEVWTFAKELAGKLSEERPELITAQYRIAKRPKNHVLVDYNQNAWGRTLASVYSVRPKPQAPVSAPVTWDEVEGGIRLEDFRMENMPARVARVGDLFLPLLAAEGRLHLEEYV